MESFEYVGEWWPAGNQENAKIGTLSFSPENGIVLETLGSFAGNLGKMLPPADVETVHGVTREGKFVTLARCSQMLPRIRMPGISTQPIRAHEAYIGHQYLGTLKFTKIAVEYTHLIDWIGKHSLDESWIDEDDLPVGIKLVARVPAPIDIHIPGLQTDISIRHRHNVHSGLRDFSIDEAVYLVISHSEALSVEEWLSQFVDPIQDLLSLATDRPNAILAMFVYSVPEIAKEKTEIDAPKEDSFQVVFQPLFHDSSAGKPIFKEQMLFSFEDIGIELSEFLTRWFDAARSLSTVRSLFLNTRYSPSRFLEARFLGLAQAAELYHRIKGNRRINLPKAEFAKRRTVLVENAPDEYKTWVCEVLQHANEVRLYERITELYNLTKDVIGQLYSDPELFAKKVRDTRNYYTHYDPSTWRKAARGEELFFLTDTLYYLLARCFLHELGFSSDQSVDLFERNIRFKAIGRR